MPLLVIYKFRISVSTQGKFKIEIRQNIFYKGQKFMNFVRELKFEQNKSSNLKNPGTSKFDLS